MFVTNLLLSSQWLDGGEAEDEDVEEEEEEDGVDQGDDPKALKLHLTIHCLYRNFFFPHNLLKGNSLWISVCFSLFCTLKMFLIKRINLTPVHYYNTCVTRVQVKLWFFIYKVE